METEALYDCSYCGETVNIAVDPTACRTQEYVEDCWVCCRPNRLLIVFDNDGKCTISAEPES
jgi:hypothetical protein